MVMLPAVMGLDFGGTKIGVAIGDANGTRMSEVVVRSVPEQGAEAALDRGLTAADELLRALPPTHHLAAVGAVTFGIPHSDRVDLAPAIPGWGRVRFGEALRSRFPGVPVRIGTDVKAAAAAERAWGALAGIRTGLYVNLGTGLAVAIVADGMVLLGANRAAGEIGYSLRSVQDVRLIPAERTLLEDAVSGGALVTRAQADLRGEISLASDVFRLARTDVRAAQLAHAFVDELSLHLTNLAIAINPARIVIGGGLTAAWSDLAPPLQTALDCAVPFPPELVLATFPYDAPLMGALAIGVGALTAPVDPHDSPDPALVPGPDDILEGRLSL